MQSPIAPISCSGEPAERERHDALGCQVEQIFNVSGGGVHR
jgi:hypothetical protein